jgi:hypothetical protein
MPQIHEIPTENIGSTTRLSNWICVLKSLSTLTGIAADDGWRQVMLLECTGACRCGRTRFNPSSTAHVNRTPGAFECCLSDVFQAIPAEVFHFKEFVDPKVGSLSAETALLYTAEGGDLIGYQPAVDPHHA